MEFDSFVLAASTADLGQEPAARSHADVVEYRMDLAESPHDALAAYDGALPLLATNRVEWEGGDAPDTTARIRALERAATLDVVGAVDVELAAIERGEGPDLDPVLAAAEASDTTVVVSVHDFVRTPVRSTLESLLARACRYGDVGKLATTARDPDDVLALLRATRTFAAAGERVATMAMGEAGRHSRAVAPLYGSRIGYAPVDPESATAPGQFDLATLRSLVETLANGGT